MNLGQRQHAADRPANLWPHGRSCPLPVLCHRLYSREGTAMVFTLRKLLMPALLGIFTVSFVPFADRSALLGPTRARL